MTERLTRVAARGFQGLDFDEDIPPRLLLTGPNGSGKTARLRAISLGVLGFQSKDGLAPWATSAIPSVVVEASSGLRVQRATKIDRSGGGLSCQNRSAVEPSQGETTAAAVEARIERDLAPNVISMTLDAFFAKSGPERRRGLLEALGADSALAPEAIQSRLDLEFAPKPGETAEDALRSGEVWGRIRRAVNPRSFSDGFAYLAALEGAARAQASEYRGQKAAADAMASGPSTPAGADPETVRRDLEGADAALRALTEARAAGRRGAEDRARRVRERDALRASLPVSVASLPPPARSDALHAAAEQKNTALEKARAALDSAEKAVPALTEAAAKARTALGRSDGRLKALKALLADPEGDECPLCGKAGYDYRHGDRMLEKADAALGAARKKSRDADAGEDAGRSAVARAREAAGAAADAAVSARDALVAGRKLSEVEAALAAGESQASAVADDGAAAAAEARVADLRASLEAAMKAEGERKARHEAAGRADSAAEKCLRAVEIQARVGPKGMQGELLVVPVERLTEGMTARWRAAGKSGTLGWALADARGGPDASLVLAGRGRGAEPIPLSSLSGGERAVAMACLVAALAEAKPDRMSVALVEAGEVDALSLKALAKALHGAPLANVVIATHVQIPTGGGSAAWEDDTGFEVRRLGGAA